MWLTKERWEDYTSTKTSTKWEHSIRSTTATTRYVKIVFCNTVAMLDINKNKNKLYQCILILQTIKKQIDTFGTKVNIKYRRWILVIYM